MDVLMQALVLAQSTVDDETAETPWLTVVIVLVVFFAVAGVVIGRLRRKAAEIE